MIIFYRTPQKKKVIPTDLLPNWPEKNPAAAKKLFKDTTKYFKFVRVPKRFVQSPVFLEDKRFFDISVEFKVEIKICSLLGCACKLVRKLQSVYKWILG